MARPHVRGALLALGASAGLILASPAVAVIPPSGHLTSGIGPAFGPIGSPGKAVAARLHLQCAADLRRRAPGAATTT